MFKRLKRRHRFNRKRSFTYLFLLLLCVSIGLGYATIKTDLNILGTSKFMDARWDVHFANIQVKENSVTPTTAATISNDTTVSFSATLEEPGEYYEFNIDVVNAGTMDAMIDSFTVLPSLTTEEQEYFDYIVTYEDGTVIDNNQKLEAGDTETLRVAFIYKQLQDTTLYPTEDQDYTVSVTMNYVQAGSTAVDVPHPPTLYSVLEDAATVGTYAVKYTGEHQDSWANNGTKDIYHWYATNDTDGTAIQDKNNVIFAGHCWQMIRTTDTGGVKMIYNGEAENNQCLNTRGTHIGYGSRTSQNLASNYYYGTSYEYDSTNNVFTLSGTLTQETWNATTGPTLVGKYTCKKTTDTGTCATLYLVESYYNTSSGYVIPISKNSHYSQFGTLAYNNNNNSLAYVGYMYNDVYPVTSKMNNFYILDSSWTVDTSYYYSDTIDWNTTTSNQYTLLNPQQLSTLSGDYRSLVGKYVLNGAGTNATVAKYIIGVGGTGLYYKYLKNGDLNTSLTIGDSYTESGGVYTLSGNVTNVPYQTWYTTSKLSVYKGKYVCDGDNISCTNIRHIVTTQNPEIRYYSYFDSSNAWSFAESVSYNGSSYTLTGDIKTLWDYFDTSVQTTIATHHYTCLGNGTSCTTVGYVYYLSDYSLYYAQLTGVADIETALNNMLYASDVNTKNSTIKTGIDAWYAKYLSSYDSYIEDTIFCNDRTIKSLGGWNPDGGAINQYLQFQEYTATKDLSCDRATDQFSTLNNSAKLTYKVGLMSNPEMDLLNRTTARVTGQYYWLASPYSFFSNYADVRDVYTSGSLGGGGTGSTYGLRPAVSILPGTVYTSGDGSMASPYIVATE